MDNKTIPETSPGSPWPLGVHFHKEGINFALVSSTAVQVTLHLFYPEQQDPFASYLLSPEQHRTGQVWHICIALEPQEIEYSYDIEHASGETYFQLIDPYAKGLSSGCIWGEKNLANTELPLRGKVHKPSLFDWEGVVSPKIPTEKLVIYEMHVRGFTAHPSSQVPSPGTFLGLIQKIPYLKELGVNAVELMPIYEFNECELDRIDPNTQQLLKNVWGYSTINFFSIMNRFCSTTGWDAAVVEFKTFVKEMHRAGIEVYLDVVYNHTAEGNEKGPVYSFRGIDQKTYYLLDSHGQYLNYSGTGNTFNANHFVGAELILASLRYFATEMHVDGFRFDLASCLTRNTFGQPVNCPLVINMMSKDPLLKEVKLIAEAWDAAGLYQVGHFPGGDRFLEWNGFYRDAVRKFIKGTDNTSGDFAQALTGSSSLYGRKHTPTASVNFVCCHDGFTLRDLVSYNEKHNMANGENNQDGNSNNESWNCGVEGETQEETILKMRKKQMRNFHVALMVSIGTPMLWMGDEYGHTKGGNNNSYCQDNEMNLFLWDRLSSDPGWKRFYQQMIFLRKQHTLFQRTTFLSNQEILWHGREPMKANWGQENRLIAYTLVHPKKRGSLYIAFNAHAEKVELTLPTPPSKELNWYRIVDTSLESPLDFMEKPLESPPLTSPYVLSAHSSLILILE